MTYSENILILLAHEKGVLKLIENGDSPLNKWAFVGKSAMTFAQIVVTVGLGSQFFEGFSLPWRVAFGVVAFMLIVLAIVVYPTRETKRGEK